MQAKKTQTLKVIKQFIIAAILSVFATTSYSQQSVLDKYVAIGIENNLAFQQKQVDLKIASKALSEAKGLFFPEVSVDARYSIAQGGRTIEFPIGDLLNPVYSSLNQLLQLPTNKEFPMLSNAEIPFLRGKEQDTKISLIQPVYNAKLNANYKLKQEQLKISRSQIRQYQNELTFEIKNAYFDYLKTIAVINLLEETKKLLNENLRVNQKLMENNMATKDAPMRAQNEISKFEMQQNEAIKNRCMAQGYFNFLINQDLESEITVDSTIFQNTLPDENYLKQTAYGNREELKQIVLGSNAYDQLAKMNSAENLPSVYLAADYGFQGEQYRFTSNDDYAMLTIGLKWTLFNGATNKSKHDQAIMQKEQIQIQKQEVVRLIELEIREGWLDVNLKQQNLNVAKRQMNEADEVYRMVISKYKNGVIPQIELLDAQNTKMQAAMNTILNQYELLNSQARLEKIVGINLH